MNKITDCKTCEFMKMYDYGSKIYYCDNETRTDDMGKLGVDYPPKTSPVWCPLRCKNDRNIDLDLIKMESGIQLTDKKGNIIDIKVPQPEYVSEIFS